MEQKSTSPLYFRRVCLSVFLFTLALLFNTSNSFAQPVCNAQFQFYANTHNPDSVHFYPVTTSAASYSWSFGDGTSSTNIDPWHLYPHAGAFYVCLTVTLSNGTACVFCDSVHVISPPPPVCNANFQFYANTHNPDSLHFYPATTSATSYTWSFGDGTTATGISPWHLYSQAGAYQVCLTIVLSNGTTCTSCDSVHVVNPPPPVCNAHFQFYSNPHNPDSIHFHPVTQASNLGIYSWSFGDGTTSNNIDPWHLYPHAGAYYVCLTVTLAGGATCTWCDSIHVISPPPPICNSHFQFYANPHNPDSIHFYPQNPASTAGTYLWTFGDGTTSTNHDPWHLYPHAGAFYVCLTVTLSNGTTCTWCDSVHVTNLPPPVCNAHFQFYANMHNPDSVHFYPNNPTASNANYFWSFGDGTSSTNHDPWHMYPHPGVYYVCLTVTLSNGTTCTSCDSVHVMNLPPPYCNAQFHFYANTHNPDSMHFFPITPVANIGTYSWSFGDGTTSTNRDPWHLYQHAGAYYVCLTVTMPGGTTCTSCDSVHVVNPPPPVCNAHFQFYANTHNPDSVHFYPQNPTLNIATYSWSFGDGTTSTNHDPLHLYPNAGAYYVCLTVSLANGTTCTWCDSIHVMTPPPPVCNAQFQSYPNPHNPDSIHYYPLNPASTNAIYSWSFGDGTGSTNHDPWHLYSAHGMYYTCLTITLSNGTTCMWCDSVLGRMAKPGQAELNNQVISLYPNPVDGSVTIDLQNIADPTIDICDLNGKLIYKSTLSGNSVTNINTSQIYSGVYYYIIRSGGQSVSQGRMVIMH